MLKLNLQNFGHLMRSADSLEKTLMLGKTEVRWRKYGSFSFSLSSSKEYSGLISLRIAGLISLQSKGPQESSPTSQFKSSNASALNFPYGPTLKLDFIVNLSSALGFPGGSDGKCLPAVQETTV